ncbi:MAG: MGH1-like glycoside hydrolase domain-containing protein [Candidatus Sumerlaeia bacterium]
MQNYEELKKELAKGWNTWDTFSVFSHALLPEGFALNLSFRDGPLRKTFHGAGHIGHYPFSIGPESDITLPGPRSYDGTYTSLDVTWRDLHLMVESATDGDDLVLLITPAEDCAKSGVLAVEAAILWGRDGSLGRDGESLVIESDSRKVQAWSTAPKVVEPYLRCTGPYLAHNLYEAIGISTGRERSLEDIQAIVSRNRKKVDAEYKKYGDLEEPYAAMRSCLIWNTIYEAEKDRVVSPVSRVWNNGWGSYVLFCWDTYFAGLMAGIENKLLAYANVIEITREHTDQGFVPNVAAYNANKSYDRSQPCVGAMVAWRLYERWGDKWFLEEIFDDLLTWNRWWKENRILEGKYLAWGTDPDTARVDSKNNDGRKRSSLESGLDNSPMYEDVAYDEETHTLKLADAGLMGMYIGDCHALANMARELGRDAEAKELDERAAFFTESCKDLWNEEAGIFQNLHTDTGKHSPRMAPCNFYPLIGKVATQAQAERMMQEHFYNAEEFWGEWMIPSCNRNDPAFEDQKYWRGPIWGPMNMLVYMGLENYELPRARKDLAEKSAHVILKEWREKKHVHENYNSINGEGCCMRASNPFYHWGGLLGLIPLIEAGYYEKA